MLFMPVWSRVYESADRKTTGFNKAVNFMAALFKTHQKGALKRSSETCVFHTVYNPDPPLLCSCN
jgi:hypothetical protein